MTLTFDPMPKLKVIGQTVRTGELGQTNRQTNKQTDATKRIISPASLSIIMTAAQGWLQMTNAQRHCTICQKFQAGKPWQTDGCYQTYFLPALQSIASGAIACWSTEILIQKNVGLRQRQGFRSRNWTYSFSMSEKSDTITLYEVASRLSQHNCIIPQKSFMYLEWTNMKWCILSSLFVLTQDDTTLDNTETLNFRGTWTTSVFATLGARPVSKSCCNAHTTGSKYGQSDSVFISTFTRCIHWWGDVMPSCWSVDANRYNLSDSLTHTGPLRHLQLAPIVIVIKQDRWSEYREGIALQYSVTCSISVDFQMYLEITLREYLGIFWSSFYLILKEGESCFSYFFKGSILKCDWCIKYDKRHVLQISMLHCLSWSKQVSKSCNCHEITIFLCTFI